MYKDDKKLAEAVLSYLCKGEEIEGVRFGASLQMLLTSRPMVKGQTYLNLVSRWAVFDSCPEKLPDSEAGIPEMSQEEQILAIYGIKWLKIVDIRLGEARPHLIMTLEDGKVLFLNGRHDLYETWQFGVICWHPDECWSLVAMPGGAIAYWVPQSAWEELELDQIANKEEK